MRNKQDHCSIVGCERPWKARQWCILHYKRWWRHNNPLYGMPKERYWRYIQKGSVDECWPWLGKTRTGKGKYGQISIDNKSISAHRFGWELTNGSIPKKMHVLHHCDNPVCQNPKHLFLGTNQDNIRDKMAKGRWGGGRKKFTPGICSDCSKTARIVKDVCQICYSREYKRRQRGWY